MPSASSAVPCASSSPTCADSGHSSAAICASGHSLAASGSTARPGGRSTRASRTWPFGNPHFFGQDVGFRGVVEGEVGDPEVGVPGGLRVEFGGGIFPFTVASFFLARARFPLVHTERRVSRGGRRHTAGRAAEQRGQPRSLPLRSSHISIPPPGGFYSRRNAARRPRGVWPQSAGPPAHDPLRP